MAFVAGPSDTLQGYLTGPAGTASGARRPEAAGDMPGDKSGLDAAVATAVTAAAVAAATFAAPEAGFAEAGLPNLLGTAVGRAGSAGRVSTCQLAFAVGTVSSGTCRLLAVRHDHKYISKRNCRHDDYNPYLLA